MESKNRHRSIATPEGRALLLVAHQPDAPLPGHRRLRPAGAGSGARLPGEFRAASTALAENYVGLPLSPATTLKGRRTLSPLETGLSPRTCRLPGSPGPTCRSRTSARSAGPPASACSSGHDLGAQVVHALDHVRVLQRGAHGARSSCRRSAWACPWARRCRATRPPRSPSGPARASVGASGSALMRCLVVTP